jgi:SAM-dependent methyltransferase
VPHELGDTRLRRALRPVLKPTVARIQQWQRRKRTVRQHWERALPREVRWARRVLTDPEAKTRWRALQPEYPWASAFPDAYAAAADRFPHGELRVVDVGAGPGCSMPKAHPGRAFHITAIDPLADEYNALLDELGIDPVVRSRPGSGEALLEVVEPNSFDLAHANNSVDHTYDPVLVIRNMVLAVKPGSGLVLLRHERNEGVNEHYRALHQWNLDADGDDLILWRPGLRRNVSRELADLAEGEVFLADRWIVWLARRR